MTTQREAPGGEITALLGCGTEFRGTLVFDGRVRIDGRLEGRIVSDGTVVIGDSAEVTAEIRVANVIVLGGIVRGDIVARASVEIHAPARVHGNITSPQVFIDKGVVYEGQCRMTDVAEET